jgi:hypothetical protein
MEKAMYLSLSSTYNVFFIFMSLVLIPFLLTLPAVRITAYNYPYRIFKPFLSLFKFKKVQFTWNWYN